MVSYVSVRAGGMALASGLNSATELMRVLYAVVRVVWWRPHLKTCGSLACILMKTGSCSVSASMLIGVPKCR